MKKKKILLPLSISREGDSFDLLLVGVNGEEMLSLRDIPRTYFTIESSRDDFDKTRRTFCDDRNGIWVTRKRA